MAFLSQYQLGGIISLAGFLPYHNVLVKHRKGLNELTPILMLHGKYDPVVPCEVGKESYEGLKTSGYPVTFKTYEAGEDHYLSSWFNRNDLINFLTKIFQNQEITPITNPRFKRQRITIQKINNTAPIGKKSWGVLVIAIIIFFSLLVCFVIRKKRKSKKIVKGKEN